jgi:hypothetical protein
MGDFRVWVIFENVDQLTLRNEDATPHLNKMDVAEVNFHLTTLKDFVGKAKALREDTVLRKLLKKAFGEKICVLTAGITDTALIERANGKEWTEIFSDIEYIDDAGVEVAYDLGEQGKKAVVISYDELVGGVDYLRPLAWSHLPTELVEEYRKAVYSLFKAEYAPISEMKKEGSSAYSETGISGAEIRIGSAGTSSKLYTFKRKRGKLF